MINKIIKGIVIHGNGLGHTVGMPTANINYPKEDIQIDNGVYATKVKIIRNIGNKKIIINKFGVTNVGPKPTIDNGISINIETHILDFNDDIYGEIIKLEFIKKIRDIKKFSNLKSVKEQVDKDIKEAIKIIEELN